MRVDRRTTEVTLVLAAMSIWVARPVLAAMGELDVAFGDGGRVVVAGNAGPHVFELGDRRILVTGPVDDLTGPIAVSRRLANGAPDPAFGSNGRTAVTIAPQSLPWMFAAALQSDGGLVIAGAEWDARSGASPYLARIDALGALDGSFAAGGTLRGYVGGTEPHYTSVVVMPSGEILAAISDWTSDRIDRFSPDGRPLGNLNGSIAPVWLALHPDGRLLVSGYHRLLHRPVVMLMDAEGRRDRTFGDNGYAVIESGYDGALVVDTPGGRILACGSRGIARLTLAGALDPSFGAAGTGYVGFDGEAAPVARACVGLVPLTDGGVAYVAARTVADGDEVLVGGLTVSGAADARFGDGTGYRRIDLGPVSAGFAIWEAPSRITATSEGHALLTWQNPSAGGPVQLVRLDLGGLAVRVDPPTTSGPNPPQPPDDPPPPPPPSPPSNGGAGGGGGGGALDLAIALLLGAAAMSAGRRQTGGRGEPVDGESG